MAGSLTNYAEEMILDHIFGRAPFAEVETPYLGLFTEAPSDAGGGTEVSGSAYARVAITTLMSDASGGTITNGSDITFAAADGGNWGTVTHFAIFDAITDGNMIAWADLTVQRAVNDGDVIKFSAGELDMTLD